MTGVSNPWEHSGTLCKAAVRLVQRINEEPVDPDWEYPDALLTGHLLHHPKSFVHSLKGSSLCAQLYER